MNANVTKITLQVGEKEIVLNLDEAQELYYSLSNMFQPKSIFDRVFDESWFARPIRGKQIPVHTRPTEQLNA